MTEEYYLLLNDIFFGRYGSPVSIQGMVEDAYSDPSFEIKTTFLNERCLKDFVSDLLKIQEEVFEARERENNPVVKRAYEEYKLLLKLSK